MKRLYYFPFWPFLLLGFALTCFLERQDVSPFFLDHAYYQVHAFLQGIPFQGNGLILPAYNPLKDVLAWFTYFTPLVLGWKTLLSAWVLRNIFGIIYNVLEEPNRWVLAFCGCLWGACLLAPQFYLFSDLWLPLCCVTTAFYFLTLPQNPFPRFSWGLLGFATGLHLPFLVGLFCAILCEGKKLFNRFFLLLWALVGWGISWCGWGISLLYAGYSISQIFTLDFFVYSTSPFYPQAGLVLIFLMALVASLLCIRLIFHRDSNKNLSKCRKTFFPYTIACGICWMGLISLVSVKNSLVWKIPFVPDCFLLMALLSIPILLVCTAYFKRSSQQFVLAMVTTAIFFFVVPSSYEERLMENISVSFPYAITPQDTVFMAPETGYLAAFFPKGTAVHLLDNSISLKNSESAFVVVNIPYLRQYTETALKEKKGIWDFFVLPSLDMGVEVAESCRPIRERLFVSSRKGFYLCKLRSKESSIAP